MDLGELESHVAALRRERAGLPEGNDKTDYLDTLLGAYEPLLERMRGRRWRSIALDGSGRRRLSASAMRLQTSLAGCRSMTITVAQLFRMSDLLIDPERVRAVEFHQTIHTVAKLKRSFHHARTIPLGELGVLKPVATFNDRFHRFWAVGIPDLSSFERSGDPPLTLVPFELSPLPRVGGIHLDANEWLKNVIRDSIESHRTGMQISSVHGNLRLYATGVGVIRVTMQLDFQESAEVEVLAALARKIESVLFVDADGASADFEWFLADVVDAVAQALFSEPVGGDRRWRPPDTMFRFHQGSFLPETHVRELAYLMSLSPGNYQGVRELELELLRQLKTPSWWRDGVLMVPSQRVVLLLKKAGGADYQKTRRRLLMDAVETHELVNAALYTRRVFTEDFAKFRRGGDLATILPGTDAYAHLTRLLDTTRRAMRAVSSLSEHLQATGEWPLVRFGQELWQADTEGGPALSFELRQVAERVRDSGYAAHPEMMAIVEKVQRIEAIEPPFARGKRGAAPQAGSAYQENLENEVLETLEALEMLLDTDHSSIAALDEAVYAFESARRALLES